MKRTLPHPWLLLTLALALAAAQGCRQSAAPSLQTTEQPGERIEAAPQTDPAPQPTAAPAESVSSPPAEARPDELVEEIWEAFSIQGTPAGHAHTTVAHVEENGQKLVRMEGRSHMVIKRAGQTTAHDMTQISWDTPEGRFVRFESRVTAGTGEVVSTGKVVGDKLEITVSTLGKEQVSSIPWQAEWGGLFAADQSLKRQPMKAGEKRTVRAMVPVLNVPCDTVLEAVGEEKVALPDGEKQLMRVNAVLDLGGQKLDTVLWVNDRGETLKSLVTSLQQETVRTTKADALKQSDGAPLDLLVASVVKVKGKPPQLDSKQVVFKAHVTSGKIEGIFEHCLSQRVKPIDEQTVELTLLAVRPTEPEKPDVDEAGPDEADSAPNSMIQSDDPEIVKMAAAAAPAGEDPWKTATALEKYVARSIKKKNFSQAFGTAAEVVRSLEGDCTEHAVLLAALCRARKIPARVAFGLVYYAPVKGFAYHMWNEVWIGDRWVPLDGTRGLGGIGADHVKLADSNLAGASAYSAMLPVVQVFGRLELEVISAE